MSTSRSSFVLSNSICSQVEQPFIRIKQTSELGQLRGDNDSLVGSFTNNSSHMHKGSIQNHLANIPMLQQQQSSLIQMAHSERILEQGLQISKIVELSKQCLQRQFKLLKGSLADHIIQKKEKEQFDNDILDDQPSAKKDEFEIQEDKQDQKF